MSPQADYVVSNGTGAAVRSDINGQLAAIVSNNSGASAPATTYAYMLWADTSTNLLKLRNGANSAWITVGDLTAANLGLATLASPTFTGTATIPTLTVSTAANIPLGSAASPTLYFTGDSNTGLYSPGADQVAISTGGSGRLFVNSSGNTGFGTSSPNATGFASTVATINIAAGSNGGLELTKNNVAAGHFTVESNANNDIRVGAVGASAALTFQTAGSERLRITSAGLVGIGTTSPASTLSVGGNAPQAGAIGAVCSAGGIALSLSDNVNSSLHVRTANGGAIIGTDAGGVLRFATNGVATTDERMRIDSSGRLLVGTSTSPSAGNWSQYALIKTQGKVGETFGPGILNLARGEAATAITADENIGGIAFSDQAGNEFALITCAADANAGSGDYPGRLVFSTTADGASSPTERMRINNDGGIVGGGNTSTYNLTTNPGFSFSPGSTAGSFNGLSLNKSASNWGTALFIHRTSGVGQGAFVEFAYSGTTIGNISNNGASNVAYNTSSDYRLKENIKPLAEAIKKLLQLKPSTFNFIIEPDRIYDGFIAHELQEVVPGAVTGEKDAVNEDGSIKAQGVDQSKLVPLLTAALQEAVAKIESLEARLTAAGI